MTETPSRHLPWDLFNRLIEQGAPAIELLSGNPRVEIFTDAGGARIGVRTPHESADVPPSQLVEIDIHSRMIGGARQLEVSTSNTSLYADFYAFACAVADRIQLQELPPQAAVEDALAAWSSLLQRVSLLTPEQQTGLMGELWLLKRLGQSIGWVQAIEAWKGPGSEEHDFSVHAVDIEVKSTLSERRHHVIGSLTQLVPTGSRPLYVLSIQFTGAGAGSGTSLAEAVEGVQRSARAHSAHVAVRLNSQLEASGWRHDSADHYTSRFELRTTPALIPVDDNFPALTPATLASLGPENRQRLLQVSYRVDLSDLGYLDGSPQFLDVIGEGLNQQ